MKRNPSSVTASSRLRNIRRSDTSAEFAICGRLRTSALEFSTNQYVEQSVKTKPDIIIADCRVAVFVDGCFWHGCPKHGTWPKANRHWWRNKIKENIRRDSRNRRALRRAGWTIIRAWEHEKADHAVRRILRIVCKKREENG